MDLTLISNHLGPVFPIKFSEKFSNNCVRDRFITFVYAANNFYAFFCQINVEKNLMTTLSRGRKNLNHVHMNV